MPLLNHFNSPLNRTHPWRSFHGAWAAAIARMLNQGVLPAGYYAIPLVDRDGPIEIDVAAMRQTGGALAREWCGVVADVGGRPRSLRSPSICPQSMVSRSKCLPTTAIRSSLRRSSC